MAPAIGRFNLAPWPLAGVSDIRLGQRALGWTHQKVNGTEAVFTAALEATDLNSTRDRLADLPLRSLAAVAARCTRRVIPIALSAASERDRAWLNEAMEHAVRASEAIARGFPPDMVSYAASHAFTPDRRAMRPNLPAIWQLATAGDHVAKSALGLSGMPTAFQENRRFYVLAQNEQPGGKQQAFEHDTLMQARTLRDEALRAHDEARIAADSHGDAEMFDAAVSADIDGLPTGSSFPEVGERVDIDGLLLWPAGMPECV
jgi:hypothetical protein